MFSSQSLTWGGVVTKSFIRVIFLDQKVYAVCEKSDWLMSTQKRSLCYPTPFNRSLPLSTALLWVQ